MLSFDWLWVFLALPLPFLVYKFLPPAEHNQEAILAVPFFKSVSQVEKTQAATEGVSRNKFILLFLVWCLLVIAAAKPMWIGEEMTLPAKGRDIMVAIDVSGSMQREDMLINDNSVDRLSMVKLVLEDFISRRQGDRLGLIIFGSNAYIQSPLTFDRETVIKFLLESQIGIAGESTAIGDAIGLALKRLKDRPVESRVLVLLTDGSNNAGAVEPLQAAKLAAEKELKIYTIGIGADEMEAPGLFGSSLFSRTVNPSADLDEAVLKSIAQTTGGNYFRARSTEDLVEIYAMLDQLEPIDSESKTFRPKKSLYYWPLAISFLLSWLYAFIVLAKHLFNENTKSELESKEEQKPNENLWGAN